MPSGGGFSLKNHQNARFLNGFVISSEIEKQLENPYFVLDQCKLRDASGQCTAKWMIWEATPSNPGRGL